MFKQASTRRPPKPYSSQDINSRKSVKSRQSLLYSFVCSQDLWLSISNGIVNFIVKALRRDNVTRLNKTLQKTTIEFSTETPRINNSIALYGSSQQLLGCPGAFYSTYIPRETGNRVFNPQISFSNDTATATLQPTVSSPFVSRILA